MNYNASGKEVTPEMDKLNVDQPQADTKYGPKDLAQLSSMAQRSPKVMLVINKKSVNTFNICVFH